MEDELWFSVEIYKLTKKKKTCVSYMIMIDKLNRIYCNIYIYVILIILFIIILIFWKIIFITKSKNSKIAQLYEKKNKLANSLQQQKKISIFFSLNTIIPKHIVLNLEFYNYIK